jgi:hypothetical protein
MPSDITSMFQFIYTKKIGVQVSTLAIIDNFAQFLMFLFVGGALIPWMKGKKIWTVMTLGALSQIFNVLELGVFMPSIPIWGKLIGRFTSQFFYTMYYNIQMILLAGSVGKLLPEGFESTGMVLFFSFFNTAVSGKIKLGQYL